MSDLVLVPTSREIDFLRGPITDHFASDREFAIQRIGFGPITAAARAGALISRYRPSRVMLIGIGGTFDPDQYPVGSACRFDQVVCDGIGSGCGSDFQSAGSMGWKQFAADDAMPEVGDRLPLVSTYSPSIACAGTLLSVCAASATQADREERQHRFPDASVEDMEGFAVAAACTMAGVPIQIVRGISNEVGDRDHVNWKIETALDHAAQMAIALMDEVWMPSIA